MPDKRNVRHVFKPLSAYTYCGKPNTAAFGAPVCQDCLKRKVANAQKFGAKHRRNQP